MLSHLDKLGGFVVKGLSREPMIGNPTAAAVGNRSRLCSNAIGLQNIGAAAFLEEKLSKLRTDKKYRCGRQCLRIYPRGLRKNDRNS